MFHMKQNIIRKTHVSRETLFKSVVHSKKYTQKMVDFKRVFPRLKEC